MKNVIATFMLLVMAGGILVLGNSRVNAASISAPFAGQVVHKGKRITRKVYHRGRKVTVVTYKHGKRVTKKVWRKSWRVGKKTAHKTKVVVVGHKKRRP